jgi:hypothetical protein
MAKHNIDAIVATTIAAEDAYLATQGPPMQATPEFDVAAMAHVRREQQRVRVLEAIHGEPKKDQAGGTEDERRADRLFSAIVKALTVRL